MFGNPVNGSVEAERRKWTVTLHKNKSAEFFAGTCVELQWVPHLHRSGPTTRGQPVCEGLQVEANRDCLH